MVTLEEKDEVKRVCVHLHNGRTLLGMDLLRNF